MRHAMRRKLQELGREEAEAILARNTHGTLACVDVDGEPYAVPLSYVTTGTGDGLKILFHCARTGHKLACIEHEPRVSFAVVDEDTIVPERFTTHYRSAVAFGRARVLAQDEIEAALAILAAKYSPGIDATEEIAGALERVCLVEIAVDRLTGKCAKELIG